MSSIVLSLYRSVIDDVINNIRDLFLDDGIDEQILTEFKQTWERKVMAAKGLNPQPSSSTAVAASSSNVSGATTAHPPTQGAGLSRASLTNFTVQRTSGSNQNTQSDNGQRTRIVQVDGPNSSDEEDEEDDFNDQDEEIEEDDDDQNDEENDYPGEEEEPLNSEDDVSDEDPSELFETDNVVVCQYDKITRSRNKWKFHLKDGIMNLQGRDYVFQKAIGDAEW